MAGTRLSERLGLSLESWNRAMLLPGGNTFLLHLRDRQPIVTKVFDSTGTVYAQAEYVPKKLDARALGRSAFRGLVLQGPEVLLFIEQESFFKNTLFRIRIDAATGRVLGEETVATGRTIRVLYRAGVPGYIVVVYNGPGSRGAVRYGISSVTRYGANGKASDAIPFCFKEMGEGGVYNYDYLMNAEMDRTGGILITAGGLCQSAAARRNGDPGKIYVFNARLRAADTTATCATMQLPDWLAPDYTVSTNFSSPTAIYQFLVSSSLSSVQQGLIRGLRRRIEGLFFQLDGNTLQPTTNRFFSIPKTSPVPILQPPALTPSALCRWLCGPMGRV